MNQSVDLSLLKDQGQCHVWLTILHIVII